MKPSIGRIVHYKDAQSIVWPAIITSVNGKELTLTVFDNSMTTPGVKTSNMATGPREANGGQCNLWWWPERV